MTRGTKRSRINWRNISPTVVLIGILAAAAAIILVRVLQGPDAIESETETTGIVTGVYQPQEIDSDVPQLVRLLVRLDASGETIQVTLSEPAAFRPGKRVALTERTTKFGRKLYRFERYLDPDEERRLLRRRWPA